jgi:hypothetical protein
MKRIFILGSAIAVLTLGILTAKSVAERDRQVDELEALQSSLDRARAAADSCGEALALEQEEFTRFDQVVDSLKAAMDAFVDPAQGGVPQADYHDYLVTFELYNSSVDVWQARADSLRANESACRALIEFHNALGDSTQRRREEILEGR